LAVSKEIHRRIEARHEEVLGKPPRIPPSDRQSVAEDVQATTQKLRGGVVGDQPSMPLEAIPEIMFTMCRFPGLWEKMIDLTLELQGANATLAVRDRKLAILRTGWLCQAPYEFGEHANQSRRAGFTEDEIERITIGSSAPEWSDDDRAILRAVEELHAEAMVSDPTWAQLSRRLDEHQLVELLILIGQFVATAYFQNSMRLRLQPDNRGLAMQHDGS
jgi:4-carboxymuconolactone decarboxylase